MLMLMLMLILYMFDKRVRGEVNPRWHPTVVDFEV
jgi:hypothetical protein